MESFEDAVASVLQHGSADWNDCIMSKSLQKAVSVGENGLSTDADQSMGCVKLYSVLTGCDIPFVKMYIMAKAGNSNGETTFIENEPLPASTPMTTLNDSHVKVRTPASLSVDHLLPLPEAHKILSMLLYCSLNANEKLNMLLPALVFCDGHVNKQGTFFLMLRKSKSNDCEIVVETINCVGPSSSTFWQSREKYVLENISKTHMASRQKFSSCDDGRATYRTMYESYAEYNIFGSSTSMSNILLKEDQIASSIIAMCCNEVSFSSSNQVYLVCVIAVCSIILVIETYFAQLIVFKIEAYFKTQKNLLLLNDRFSAC